MNALRFAGQVATIGLATACAPTAGLTGVVVAALGARDGYVFVVSPFNCLLSGDQIDVLNAIGQRPRRSGLIVAAGGVAEDTAAAAAVEALGIRMRTTRLTGSALERELRSLGWQPPLAIALRRGEIISVLKGEDARRFDTWVAWLEHRRSRLEPGEFP